MRETGSVEVDRRLGLATLGVALVAVLFAFSFQGSRGIWDPDEGFYSNVAVGMLESGDWLVPRLNGEPFLDKPPLLYWTMAGAMRLFGVNEWAARAPHALWFAATALILGALAARWWGRRAGMITVGVYAGSLAPFVAGNIVTPDTPLAFASALAYYLYWRLEEVSRLGPRLGWGALLGGSLGLGFLAKGPAILVLAAPLALHALVRRRSVVRLVEPGFGAAATLAALVALPWYVLVATRLPGGLAYMFDSQVVGRLVTAEFARNAGLFGGVKVYLPTLLFGALPWSVLWVFRLRRSGSLFSRRVWTRLYRRRTALLILLWFFVPLAVFVVASSRLPLYVLPLFAPIALVTARRLSLARSSLAVVSNRRGWLAAAVVWVVLLVALKAFGGVIDNHNDARAISAALQRQGVPSTQLLVTVDNKHNGLAFYGYPRLEMVTTEDDAYPFFAITEAWNEEIREITSGEARPMLLVNPRQVTDLVRALRENQIPASSSPLSGSLWLVQRGDNQNRDGALSEGLVQEGVARQRSGGVTGS